MIHIDEPRKQELIRLFMACFKGVEKREEAESQIQLISLEELKRLDQMLGSKDLNASYRLRLQSEIRNREGGNKRLIDIATGVIVGVVVTFLVVKVLGWT